MKTKKYIIFFDLDGTLVKEGSYLIDDNIISELIRIRDKGNILCVSTGRAPELAMKVDGKDVFAYFACLLGNVIIKSNDKKHKIVINKPDITRTKEFIDFLIINNYEWTYKDDWSEKTISNNKNIINKYLSKHIDVGELNCDLENGKVFQILVDGYLSKETIEKFDYFNFYAQPSQHYDITAKINNKANAINYIKKLYPNYIPIAIGDSNNDLEMFRNVDISIAMGDASDTVKSNASYVTKKISEGGIIYAIKNILKI